MIMQAEARAILDVFRSRGLRAGSFVGFTEFGEAIQWRNGFIRDEPTRQAFKMLVQDGYVVEMNAGLELTERGEEQLYGSTLKHGARVYRVGARILVKQTVLRGTPPEYVIDEQRERHVHQDDDRGIATAIRDALEGRLQEGPVQG
jgi:hypothetical protein